ncbi:hypothetical protein A6770_06610 [Nostoc minutum NIES-26]|uniref:Uncharacterized protein n=1 Tax=Nostoc minutum NIES-26 TaxID=1844469 RepID=A0A367Q397_9NOSO|nr:hypothetical protein A6770_06610 [Nostoc minutum NIES-26]
MFTETGLLYRNFINSKLVFYVAYVVSFATTFATVNPSEAAQVRYRSPGDVSAIDGLVVAGKTYNVTFKVDTFVNLFGYPDNPDFKSPTFWNNSPTSTVDSIISLLSNEPSIPQQINNISYALVPYQGIKSGEESWYIANKVGDYITNWSNARGESKDTFVLSNEKANYALFTTKPSMKVPEPNSAIVWFTLVLGLKHFKNGFLKVR